MAHEILTVKLCELEDQIFRLISRIHLSETANHDQLRQELKALAQECAESELTIQSKLQKSRAGNISILANSYNEIEQIIKYTKELLQKQLNGSNTESDSEEKILLAEYVLDFSIQSANRALLLSMQAIDAQLIEEERSSK